MKEHGTATGKTTEEQTRRLKIQAQYLLFKLGYTQAKAAKQLCISRSSMSQLVKANGWRDKLKRNKKTIAANALKFDDSLSAFIVFVSKKEPLLMDNIQPVYKQFLNTL